MVDNVMQDEQVDESGRERGTRWHEQYEAGVGG
jgi:hypothetical protein